MELTDYIKEIFDERNFNLARSFQATKLNPWYKTYTEDLPSVLKKLVNKLEEAKIKDSYKYEGSIGAGKRAEVFWFGCRHPELALTWSDGFYIVYLLSSDGKRLYLSLILGTEIIASTTELEIKSHLLEQEKNRITADLKAVAGGSDGLDLSTFDFGNIKLGCSPLAKAYEIASILNIMYDSKDGAPSQEQLENDLSNFLVVYKRCRFIYSGKKVPNRK